MLVANWMTKNVITLTSDRSMMKASKLMKDNAISSMPIVDEDGKIVGILADRDVKDASPSKATTLDMHELYYLLSEIEIKDIMTKKVVTIRADETVEKAAVLMLEGHFGSLPVVDEEQKVIGIITDTDVFKVLVDISGVYKGGTQVCLQIPTEPGSLMPVLEFLKNYGARIMSLFTRNVEETQEVKDVYIRIRDMEKPEFKRLKKDFEAKFNVQFWAVDPVHRVPCFNPHRSAATPAVKTRSAPCICTTLASLTVSGARRTHGILRCRGRESRIAWRVLKSSGGCREPLSRGS